MTDIDTLLAQLYPILRSHEIAAETGEMDRAREAWGRAMAMVEGALANAHDEGRAEVIAEREEGRDRDPAEDYEPDISDVGWDPWMGTYSDDC